MTTRTPPPPAGSPRLWLALSFRVGMLAVLLWLTGFCVQHRTWAGLAVTVVFVVGQAVVLGVFIWSLSRYYGTMRKALRR